MNRDLERAEIRVEKDDDGRRLDALISDVMEEISRSKVQRLITEGMVILSSNPSETLEKNRKVKAGEIYLLSLPEEKTGEIEAEPLREDVKIVYEDSEILVVDKPRNMVVHPGAGNEKGTLLAGILSHVGPSLKEVGDRERPGIVHRIDKDTSGLMVIAKTERAYESLRKQFDDHSASRTYMGICYNNIKEDALTIDRNIERDPVNRIKFSVTDLGGRRAVTHIAVVKRFGNYTLFEAKLETGRTHQIRVHMASMGHPILGDTVYGPKADKLKMGGQILHAMGLELTHPLSGERIKFESPMPDYFKKALAKIGER